MSIPYSPDALDRIRAGASARELGWDNTFYAYVCRKHELAPVASCSSPAVLPSVDAAPAAPKPELAPAPVVTLHGDPVQEPCTFDPVSGAIHRGRTTVMLTPRQAELFAVLARAKRGEVVHRDTFVRCVRIQPEYAAVMFSQMRTALRRAWIAVDSQKGRSGGRWLADARTGVPLAVTVIESENNTNNPS